MRYSVIMFVLLVPALAFGQNQPGGSSGRDTLSLKDFLLKPKLSLRAKMVFMNTLNEGTLKDDHALAGGVGAGLTTPVYKGWQAGISGFVVYNIWSSDLTVNDRTTETGNRYESGLFDVLHPKRKYHLARLEDLFISYTRKQSTLHLGRMRLRSPLLNPQDGRMNTTMEEGLQLNTRIGLHIDLSTAWIWRISPRSTTEWMPVGATLGVYNPGVNVDGSRSAYYGNVRSAGILQVQGTIRLSSKIRINIWETFTENVFNSVLVEVVNDSAGQSRFYRKIFFMHQDAVADGGNPDQSKTYMPRGTQSNSLSCQLGMRQKRNVSTLNFTWVTGDGRFLAPREWGSDYFHTFMAREKMDGIGGAWAATFQTSWSMKDKRLRVGTGYGYFQHPDVKNYRLNKYAIPSYYQVIGFVTYSFKKIKNLDLIVFSACKVGIGNTYDNPAYVFNKVNLVNTSVTVNYRR